MFTPVFTPRDRSRCEHRCEHLRHGPNLMSVRASGAWRVCSLDALTAWKRPEPTKWAVVVIFCARATNHENEVFSVKLASRARAPSLTTTAHFVGSGRVQAVSACREHALHAPDVRSDIRFGPWRRCSHLCSHLPGSRGRSYSSQYLSAHCVKQPISEPIEHTDHYLTSRAHQIAGLVVCDECISSNAKIPHIYTPS